MKILPVGSFRIIQGTQYSECNASTECVLLKVVMFCWMFALFPGIPTRNEKYLAALATGKWVLHKSYLEACRVEKAFVEVSFPLISKFVYSTTCRYTLFYAYPKLWDFVNEVDMVSGICSALCCKLKMQMDGKKMIC